MLRAKRSILALIVSAVAFGVVSVPYYFLAAYAVAGFLFLFPFQTVVSLSLLAASTALLSASFIRKTNLEVRVANRFGRYSRPLAITALIMAVVYTCLTARALASFPLSTPLESWYALVIVAGIATAVAFVAIIILRPSRLEKFVAFKLSPGNGAHLAHRAVVYVLLALGLALTLTTAYEYRHTTHHLH